MNGNVKSCPITLQEQEMSILLRLVNLYDLYCMKKFII